MSHRTDTSTPQTPSQHCSGGIWGSPSCFGGGPQAPSYDCIPHPWNSPDPPDCGSSEGSCTGGESCGSNTTCSGRGCYPRLRPLPPMSPSPLSGYQEAQHSAFHSGGLSSVRVWDLPLGALAPGRGHLRHLLSLL